WTYVTWGLYHALLFVPLILLGRTKAYTGVATWKQIPQIILTFVLATIGWILFRAPSIADAWEYICGMSGSWGIPTIINTTYILPIPFLMLIFVFVEWRFRHHQHGLDVQHLALWKRWLIYICIFVLIFTFGAKAETFIYFQF
ncbi:MAG: hypothetical protein MJZ92_03470, partial [Paludibacteraceae bacterium]|nr:hypothetical protein [Paludibacteraceae bacterium]